MSVSVSSKTAEANIPSQTKSHGTNLYKRATIRQISYYASSSKNVNKTPASPHGMTHLHIHFISK
jgi:hypothetical protein